MARHSPYKPNIMSTTFQDFPEKSTATSDRVKDQMPQSGDILGHCRIIELIAAGGMANVYKVWHEQLEVIRAIKILKPGYDEESKARLETEAKISANLRHPNIVEIYGMGYWNEIPFIEMEYVDGPSLKSLLEESGRLPLEFSIALTHAVCTALQFAHNQDLTLYGKVYDGLIHRDIKPANILISSRGIVKLADFGIARPSDVSLHTVGSKVMGTFAYLSPEQLNGERLDHRSDIYSLGTVLYEMITGTKTYPQKMLAELVHRKTKGQYIPVGSMGKNIPKPLCNTVDKSLMLDRNKRHQDAFEFDKELLASFKKQTSKSPEEIIRLFIKHPLPLPKYTKHLQGNAAKPLIIAAIIFIIATFAGVYLLDKYGDTFFNRQQTAAPLETSALDSLPVIPEPEQPKTTPKKQKAKPVLSNQEKSVSASTPASTDDFEKGIAEYKSKNYSSAIDILSKLDPEKLDTKKQNLRIIRILESYIKSGNSEKALSFSESENVNDALFSYLKAELYFKSRQYEKAEAEFKTASELTSQFDNSVQKKASFYIAKVRDALYLFKPNIDNKQLCVRAWTLYVEKYCATLDGSDECVTAHEQLAKLK